MWSGERNRTNGGFGPSASAAEWKVLCDRPKAIIDHTGPNPRYKKQVAVFKKSLVVNRNSMMTSKEAEAVDEHKKAPAEQTP